MSFTFTSTQSVDEHDLVAACVRQERWAQRQIYETHYSIMMGVCLRYSNGGSDAEDILQEGFIKVFRYIRKYQAGTSLKAWIRRIMVNTAIDFYRKAVRRRTEDIENVFDVTSHTVDAVSQCGEHEILALVQKLTPAYRTVFNLYVIEGYSHKEIGKLLDITESTSRSNLVKARTKLQHMITSQQNTSR